MLGHLRRSGGRQFYAVLLIFALMMQGLAFAFAAATSHHVTDAASDAGLPGFEICYHGSPSDDSGDPAVPESSGVHCIFCLAAADHALEAPLPSTEFYVILLTTTVRWSFTAWRLPALIIDASKPPRGPPIEA
jgi:hypothetical protein